MPKEIEPEKTANLTGEERERDLTEPGLTVDAVPAPSSPRSSRKVVMTGGITLAVAALVFAVWFFGLRRPAPTKPDAKAEQSQEHGGDAGGMAHEVVLSPEGLVAAKIEIEGVTQRPSVALLTVTGTVETNPQQTQQATPLVSGRVERVNVVLGDWVQAGTVLAVISSPQIAQMHGKLHEAETQLALVERNLARVLKVENRVAVAQAKARLNEAETTLKRTRRLIELGAGAGKDLIAAETAFQIAKADHDFQTNISLNREVQEAQAAVETARVDVGHLRDEIRALGAPVRENERNDHRNDTSLIRLVAPAAGLVTERLINPGAGIEAGKPLFTIANTSTMWVIANVPEAQLGNLREGTPAVVRSSIFGTDPINGRVSYIDPQLNETTRSGRVRIEVPNPGERLRGGMFVEIGFQTGTNSVTGLELVIPTAAVQRAGGRALVFIPKENEPGAFEIREVEVGGESGGYTRVLNGLAIGEKVVTQGSFALKTQLEKGAMGDEH
jgi:cobalt-zinc-cadmium efflux system membrane fusion protein